MVSTTDPKVISQLFKAVEQSNCPQLLELIVSNHCDPRSICNDKEESLLDIASQKSDLQMIRLLVEVYKCNPSTRNTFDLCPTDYAHLAGRVDAVLYFKTYDLSKATQGGNIPLIRLVCAASQFKDSVSNLKPILFSDAYYIICKHLGAVPFESLRPFTDIDTTLKFACDTGNVDIARLVLDELANGMFFNSLDSLPSDQKTVISTILIEGAYRFGHNRLADYLIHNKGLSILYHSSEKCLNIPLKQKKQSNVLKKSSGACSNQQPATEVSHPNVNHKIYRVDNHNISRLSHQMAIHSAVLYGNLTAIKNFLQPQYYANQSLINAEGDTLLHTACVAAGLEVVKYLVNVMKLDINCTNARKNTPLHVAIEWGSVEVANFLLDKGCAIDVANDLGQTPFYLAVINRRVGLCQSLLNRNVNVNVQTTDSKETPLHLACCYDSIELATLLLECGQQSCHNVVDAFGDTPLFNACRVDSVELKLIKVMIEKGCDPFIVNNVTKETPVHIACRKKRIDVIQVLISGRMQEPINQCNYVGMSLLHLACYNDDEQMVEFLLSNNICHINDLDVFGVAPLHIAAQRNLLGILRLLLNSRHYSDIQVIDTTDNVALHHICEHEVVEKESVVMLASDTTITHQNKKGYNPLHTILCSNYGIVSIQCLLNHPKVKIESKMSALLAPDTDGNSPLHLACCCGNSAPVLCLLNSNSFDSEVITTALLQENAEKETPLHLACTKDHIAIIDCVLKHPKLSDECIREMVTRENRNGHTILHIACRNTCADMMKCILNRLKEDVVKLSMTKSTPYDGKSPLHLACEANSLAVITCFLQFGFNDELVKLIFLELSTNKGESLLHAASKGSNSFDIPKLLIDQQLCNVTLPNEHGDTALHLACKRGNTKLALLLCESGCNPHCLNKQGESPASLAIPYLFHRGGGDSSTLIQLIKNGYCNWEDPVQQREYCAPNVQLLQFIDFDSTTYCYTSRESPLSVQLPLLHSLVTMCRDRYYQMNVLQPLLHNALQNHHLSSGVRDSFGNTILHLCAYIDRRRDYDYFHNANGFDIVSCFLHLDDCDINIQNQEGNTPLHIACLSNNDGMARVLMQSGKAGASLNTKNTNGSLPIHCASSVSVLNCLIAHGANIDDITNSHLAERLKQNYLQFKTSYPLSPAITVLVIGNSLAGKTTLVKSLKLNLEMSVTDIGDGGHCPTAGIVKYEVDSQEFGKIIFHDFAGQPEYESSHSILLQSISSSSKTTGTLPLLFFLVIDVTAPNMIKHLRYWLSFIQNCPLTTAHVVVVGSHVDCLNISDRPSKADIIKNEIDTRVKNTSMCVRLVGTPLLLNCRTLGKDESQKLSLLFTETKDELKKCAELDHRCHVLFAFLLRTFPDFPVKLIDLQRQLRRERTFFGIELPITESILVELLETMHSRQHLLLLKQGAQNPSEYWIMTSKAQNLLFTRVNGVLFAPENFEKHIKLDSNVGVITSTILVKNFLNVNFDVLHRFLVYSELCQKIEDQETLKLIQSSSSNESEAMDVGTDETAIIEISLLNGEKISLSCPVHYYFFPGLVEAEKPPDIWMASEEYSYSSAWCLECTEGEFFTVQFLQVLLLRNTFSFAAKRQLGSNLKRKCVIWKNGVFWGTANGVEALVEVIEQNTVVIVLVRSLIGHEMEAVKLRSAVVKEVLKTKDRFCHRLRVSEYLINPSSLAKFEDLQVTMSHINKIPISELVGSILSGAPCVQDPQSRPIPIKTILHFEPYAGIGKNSELLAFLFDPDKAEEQIPERFLSEYANLVHEIGVQPNQIALMMNIPTREAAQSKATEPENPSMQLFRLFLYGVLTYRNLREHFDSCSIFRERDPLEMCKQSEKQHNYLTNK